MISSKNIILLMPVLLSTFLESVYSSNFGYPQGNYYQNERPVPVIRQPIFRYRQEKTPNFDQRMNSKIPLYDRRNDDGLNSRPQSRRLQDYPTAVVQDPSLRTPLYDGRPDEIVPPHMHSMPTSRRRYPPHRPVTVQNPRIKPPLYDEREIMYDIPTTRRVYVRPPERIQDPIIKPPLYDEREIMYDIPTTRRVYVRPPERIQDPIIRTPLYEEGDEEIESIYDIPTSHTRYQRPPGTIQESTIKNPLYDSSDDVNEPLSTDGIPKSRRRYARSPVIVEDPTVKSEKDVFKRIDSDAEDVEKVIKSFYQNVLSDKNKLMVDLQLLKQMIYNAPVSNSENSISPGQLRSLSTEQQSLQGQKTPITQRNFIPTTSPDDQVDDPRHQTPGGIKDQKENINSKEKVQKDQNSNSEKIKSEEPKKEFSTKIVLPKI
ncbi:uncharacterized protein LOC142332637 isoform X2 [Lycorma delicatula]|uniref:uncharacterized protein LOC142332637 isoform X2 n=1 Tax=Lycorma delicatula TaxID=130591 RepID=UPI003F516940